MQIERHHGGALHDKLSHDKKRDSSFVPTQFSPRGRYYEKQTLELEHQLRERKKMNTATNGSHYLQICKVPRYHLLLLHTKERKDSFLRRVYKIHDRYTLSYLCTSSHPTKSCFLTSTQFLGCSRNQKTALIDFLIIQIRGFLILKRI